MCINNFYQIKIHHSPTKQHHQHSYLNQTLQLRYQDMIVATFDTHAHYGC